MSDDLREFERLQKLIESISDKISRRQGQIESNLLELDRTYNCGSLSAAKKKRDQLRKNAKKLEREISAEIKSFVRKYGSRLDQISEQD